MDELTIREVVRQRYAEAATGGGSCECGGVFGGALYDINLAADKRVVLAEAEFRDSLAAAGLVDVEVRPTHRVHPHASSAIVRASKP